MTCLLPAQTAGDCALSMETGSDHPQQQGHPEGPPAAVPGACGHALPTAAAHGFALVCAALHTSFTARSVPARQTSNRLSKGTNADAEPAGASARRSAVSSHKVGALVGQPEPWRPCAGLAYNVKVRLHDGLGRQLELVAPQGAVCLRLNRSGGEGRTGNKEAHSRKRT